MTLGSLGNSSYFFTKMCIIVICKGSGEDKIINKYGNVCESIQYNALNKWNNKYMFLRNLLQSYFKNSNLSNIYGVPITNVQDLVADKTKYVPIFVELVF